MGYHGPNTHSSNPLTKLVHWRAHACLDCDIPSTAAGFILSLGRQFLHSAKFGSIKDFYLKLIKYVFMDFITPVSSYLDKFS